mgnify:CR=1 FL=1
MGMSEFYGTRDDAESAVVEEQVHDDKQQADEAGEQAGIQLIGTERRRQRRDFSDVQGDPIQRSNTMQVSLAAEARSDFGKGAARRLRRDGRVPAVVYGQGTTPVHVSVSAHELDAILKNKGLVVELTGAGNGAKVGVRDVQKDAVKNTIEHIDLVVLTAAEAAARA